MGFLFKLPNPKILLPLLGIFVVLGLGGAYYYYQVYLPAGGRPLIGEVTSPPPPTVTTEEDPTKDWNTYTNNKYGYEFKYPKNWRVARDYINYLVNERKLFQYVNSNASIDDYIVVTKLSVAEELEEIKGMQADVSGFSALAFALGRAIVLQPIKQSYQDYTKIYLPYEETKLQEDFKLHSGSVIKRILREEKDDYGHYIYDIFLYPYDKGGFSFLEIKIDTLNNPFYEEKPLNSGYEKEVFELLINTIIIK